MHEDPALIASLEARRCRGNHDGAVGRRAGAVAGLRAALADAVAALGEDHLLVAELRNDLAVTYKDAGRPDEAGALYRQALSALMSHLGPDHPTTRAVRHGYAALLTELGRDRDALTVLAGAPEPADTTRKGKR